MGHNLHFARRPNARRDPYGQRFVAQRAGFGPADVLALSPAAWFRFGVGLTVATGVSQWSDQSGNSRHLLQATGSLQPAKQADNSLLFDGATQFMKCTGFALVQPETVYLLFRQVTWTSGDRVFDGNAANTMTCLQNLATPQIRIFATSGFNDGNLAVNTYGVAAFVFNGASSVLQVNRNAPTTGDAGASNGAGFTLGADSGGANAGNIQVKEVIVFPAAHGADTRAKVIGYLAALGGVSV